MYTLHNLSDQGSSCSLYVIFPRPSGWETRVSLNVPLRTVLLGEIVYLRTLASIKRSQTLNISIPPVAAYKIAIAYFISHGGGVKISDFMCTLWKSAPYAYK